MWGHVGCLAAQTMENRQREHQSDLRALGESVHCAWPSPLFRPSARRWALNWQLLRGVSPHTHSGGKARQPSRRWNSSGRKKQKSYRLLCIYPCNLGRFQSWGFRRQRSVSGIWAARRGISGPACTGEGPGWISVRGSCCPRACAPHPNCCSLPSRIHRSPRTFSGTKAPAQTVGERKENVEVVRW